MKKSEFEKMRTEFWVERLMNNAPCGYVLQDVQAAEAAGVEWDPEAMPLPRRIDLDRRQKRLMADGNFWATLETPGWNAISEEDRLALAVETVRRYSAVTEALDYADKLYPNRTGDSPIECLSKILRGNKA